MVNNGYSSINILLLTLCYLSALFLVHKIVYQLALILFGRIWSRFYSPIIPNKDRSPIASIPELVI